MHGLTEIKRANTARSANKEDLYRVQRDQLAKHLRNVIARIGDHGQEQAIREAREYLDKL